MKKIAGALLTLAAAAMLFTGCIGINAGQAAQFDAEKRITTVSREGGSGTRGAFIELFKVEVRNSDGGRKDMTTKNAIVSNKTDVMLTNISGYKYAIGYVSVGSLNDTVKALDINGVAANAANIKNSTYKIYRPFNIITSKEVTGLQKDFIDFIMSKKGQEVVVASRYVAVDDQAAPYAGGKPAGRIVVAGSSSVTPVMEKLKEAYEDMNPEANIEIQMSDSTAGITSTIEGTCDIGMASRGLKDSEKGKQLNSITIALDGIAVIVNNSNPHDGLTGEQVRQIFTGEITHWTNLSGQEGIQ